jgi:arylsulfatase
VSLYASPFRFTGDLAKVVVTIEDDQFADAEGAAQAVLARE